jgi:protein TonB
LPASSLSPLTVFALVASLAAHGGAAMYMAGQQASAPAESSAVVTSIEVETIALPEPAQPEVPPNVVPEPTPPAPAASAPAESARVHVAVLRPAPTESAPTPVKDPAPIAAAANVLTAPGDDSPHFAMVLGAGAVNPGGLTRAGGGGGAAPSGAAAASDGPFAADGVDKLAHLESGPAPAYPADARDNGVEADVPLDIVVDENGRVTDVRPTRHLGYGLDEAAAAAIRGYRFSPAMRGGRPVKVRMRWTVVFRLS